MHIGKHTRGLLEHDSAERLNAAYLATVVSIQDPDNPYRYLQIRGRVVEVTEKGADDHIDSLAKKYTGQERYAHRRPGEVRITVKVLPEKIQSMG